MIQHSLSRSMVVRLGRTVVASCAIATLAAFGIASSGSAFGSASGGEADGRTAPGVESFCVSHTVPIVPCDGSCVAVPTAVAATEVDGIRHVVWLQTQGGFEFFAAKILPDGTSAVTTVPLPPLSGEALSLAAHADVLVVGSWSGLSIYRLIDHEWEVEATWTGADNAGRRVAIAVAPDDVVRVLATFTSILDSSTASSPVRIYRYDDAWTLEATLPPVSGGAFGADIALDGDTLVVGSPKFDAFGSPATNVHVYRLSDGEWISEAALDFDNGDSVEWISMPPAIGHRVALAGDTLVAMNAHPFALFGSRISGVASRTGLVVHHRGPAGWTQTDFIGPPSTRFGMGYELKAFMDGEDVIVLATVHRIFSPVIDGLLAFRIRDGVVTQESSVSVPSPEFPALNATTYDVARVTGESTWLAVTVPKDPVAAIRVLELDSSRCPRELVGDLDGDGVVDGADLGILLQNWGPCPECPADLNGDGFVDAADLGILLNAWSVDP